MVLVMPASLIAPEASELAAATEKVLASNLFRASPALAKLLGYLSENNGDRLSEYAIAIDGLGRKTDFNPAAESTVRVQIKRLRERLDAFYAGEGKDETVQIHIPMGGHQLALRSHHPEPRQGVLPVAEPALQGPMPVSAARRAWAHPFYYIWIPVCVAALLAPWGLRLSSTKWADVRSNGLAGVWSDLFHDNHSARIIIPSPVFFSWKNASGDRLMVRDTEVNSYSDLGKSEKLTAISSHLGKPDLVQAYTVAPDTFASFKLLQYLNHHGVDVIASPDGDPLTVSQTGESVILIGTSHTLAPYSMYFKDLGFAMDSASGTVTNLKPLGGESKTYSVVQESPERKLSPAIIAVTPLAGMKARMLIVLSSFDTTGAIEFLTSSAGIKELDAARAKAKAEGYFAAVVETETKDDATLHTSVVAVHDLGASR